MDNRLENVYYRESCTLPSKVPNFDHRSWLTAFIPNWNEPGQGAMMFILILKTSPPLSPSQNETLGNISIWMLSSKKVVVWVGLCLGRFCCGDGGVRPNHGKEQWQQLHVWVPCYGLVQVSSRLGRPATGEPSIPCLFSLIKFWGSHWGVSHMNIKDTAQGPLDLERWRKQALYPPSSALARFPSQFPPSEHLH